MRKSSWDRDRTSASDRSIAPRCCASATTRPSRILIEEFGELRRASLERLEGFRLTEADLDRTGVHPEFGPVTLRQLLSTWVVHDLDHIVQISRVMARQMTADVGPWVAYLRVLREA